MNTLAIFALLATGASSGGDTPSPSEIMKRCQHAYDSVKSFEEDVRGSISGPSAGSTFSAPGTAHISFVRPGRLRVSGNTMFGNTYDMLVNGSTSWEKMNGAWSQAQDPGRSIAGITGISANAGTRVPVLLLHVAAIPVPTFVSVKSERVNNRGTYRLTSKDWMSTTFWIDQKTYFLVKTTGVAMGSVITVSFGVPKVNKPIPSSRFVR